jgi:SHS2 domain-containing protein
MRLSRRCANWLRSLLDDPGYDSAAVYELFEHTADLGLRVRAAHLDELFAEAGRGFFSMIVDDLDQVAQTQRLHLAVRGRDPADLLVDWLQELLVAFETRGVVLSGFDVRVGDDGLEAEARGEDLDPDRHRLLHEVKAVTYHGLRVERDEEGWVAEVIVDI